jgi:hypothetical protein
MRRRCGNGRRKGGDRRPARFRPMIAVGPVAATRMFRRELV